MSVVVLLPNAVLRLGDLEATPIVRHCNEPVRGGVVAG